MVHDKEFRLPDCVVYYYFTCVPSLQQYFYFNFLDFHKFLVCPVKLRYSSVKELINTKVLISLNAKHNNDELFMLNRLLWFRGLGF
jgi:hypothetical protein